MEYIAKNDLFDIIASHYSASDDEAEETLGRIMEEVRIFPPADVVERSVWHKTTETMPEAADTYLVATSQKKVVLASFSPLRNRFNSSAGKSCTHWMEKPDGPWEKELS